MIKEPIKFTIDLLLAIKGNLRKYDIRLFQSTDSEDTTLILDSRNFRNSLVMHDNNSENISKIIIEIIKSEWKSGNNVLGWTSGHTNYIKLSMIHEGEAPVTSVRTEYATYYASRLIPLLEDIKEDVLPSLWYEPMPDPIPQSPLCPEIV